MLDRCGTILVISATINVCVGLFFILGPVFYKLLLKCSGKFAEKLIRLHKEKPEFFNKLFRDLLFYLLSFGNGVYLLRQTNILKNPFFEFNSFIQISLSIGIGHYIYKIVQDYLLREQLTAFYVNMLHHLVTLFSYSIFLFKEQNVVYGVLGLLFEGNILFFEIGKLLKYLQLEKSLAYILVLLLGFLATFIIRGIVPVFVLVYILRNSNPFNMSYLPLACFFLDIIFFAMVNLWFIRASITSLLRGIQRRHWRIQARNDVTAENLRLDIYANRYIYTNDLSLTNRRTCEGDAPLEEMINNARIQATNLAVHSIIPVSNVNVNTSQNGNNEDSQCDRDLPSLTELDNSYWEES